MLSLGGGCPYKYEPGLGAWSCPRFQSASLTYSGSERACPYRSLACQLERKESAWEEELLVMMVPEGGYHGKNNE
jgi:hypothetical protein